MPILKYRFIATFLSLLIVGTSVGLAPRIVLSASDTASAPYPTFRTAMFMGAAIGYDVGWRHGDAKFNRKVNFPGVHQNINAGGSKWNPNRPGAGSGQPGNRYGAGNRSGSRPGVGSRTGQRPSTRQRPSSRSSYGGYNRGRSIANNSRRVAQRRSGLRNSGARRSGAGVRRSGVGARRSGSSVRRFGGGGRRVGGAGRRI